MKPVGRSGGTQQLVVCLAVALCAPGLARAYGQYEADIPNGACIHCHGANDTLDAFGLLVQQQLATGGIRWANLYAGDADGDGYTNGEELGDPCGVWVRGAVPRFQAGITQPGNGGSVPTQHTVALCGGSSSAPGSSSRVSSSSGISGSSTSLMSSSVGVSSSAAPGSTSVDSSGPAPSSVGMASSAVPSSSSTGGTVDVPGCGSSQAAQPGVSAWSILLLALATRRWTRQR